MAKYVKKFSEAHHGGRVRKTESGRFVAERSTDGKLRRATFDLKSEAIGWLKDLGARRDKQGHLATALTANQSGDALDALQRLHAAGLDVSLCHAIDFYRKHHKPSGGHTVKEIFDTYLHALENPQDGTNPARARTVREKKERLSSFIEIYGESPIVQITSQDVEGWLHSTEAEGRNLRNYKTQIQSLFNYAGKVDPDFQNKVANYPQKKKQETEPAAIITTKQARHILDFMEERNPQAALVLALGCLAGLRTDEICGKAGLQWQDVDFHEKRIIVPATQAKTRKAREVQLCPALLSWLAKYKQDEGRIGVGEDGFYHRRKEACTALKITFPQNAARHSFGTYHARLHGIRSTADAIGHRGGTAILEDS